MTPDTLAQIAALHTQLATLYTLAAQIPSALPAAAVSGPVAAVEAAPLPVVPPAAQRARPAVASPRPAAAPAAAPAPVEPPPAAAPAPAAPAADEVPVAEVLKAMQGHAQRNKAKGGAVATLKSVKGFGGWTTASAVPADKRAALIAHLNSEG
jgi:hypothetical protein